MRIRWVLTGPIVCSALLVACAGGSPASPTSSAGGALVFKAAPLEPSTIRQIVPLGNLNPPDHTLPTDHIYVNNRAFGGPPAAPQPVIAPGEGSVQFILRNGAEAKVGIQTGDFIYYVDHVQLDASIREGTRVDAGQRLGMTGTAAYGIDLGVINNRVTVSFANPARYSAESLHGDGPLKYFEEPLRSQLYALVSTIGADKDGVFHYDVIGRLVGNWFLEGLAPSQSAGPSAWPQHLAFVYDNYDPSNIRVSIGGTLALVGAFAVQSGALDPKDVSVASGRITYGLFLSGAPGQGKGPQIGAMIVQMIDDGRLRAEVFPGSATSDLAFTSGARVYVR